MLRRKAWVQVQVVQEEVWDEGNLFTGFRLVDTTDGFVWLVCGTLFDEDDYRPLKGIWDAKEPDPVKVRLDAEPRADEKAFADLAQDSAALPVLLNIVKARKGDMSRPFTIRADYAFDIEPPSESDLTVAEYVVYPVPMAQLPLNSPQMWAVATPATGAGAIIDIFPTRDAAVREAVRLTSETRRPILWSWDSMSAKTLNFAQIYGGFTPGQIVNFSAGVQPGKSNLSAFYQAYQQICGLTRPFYTVLPARPLCPHCHGTGKVAHWKVNVRMKCPHCNGTGYVPEVQKGMRQKAIRSRRSKKKR